MKQFIECSVGEPARMVCIRVDSIICFGVDFDHPDKTFIETEGGKDPCVVNHRYNDVFKAIDRALKEHP